MLELLELTGIATIQDSGRRGWKKFGVPTSGPMDWFAHQAANSLLDTPPNSAVIELGLGEITFRALRDTTLAVTGAGYEVETYVWTFPLWTTFYVRAGWTVRVKKISGGNWAYIAIAGGFDSPIIMNSRSAYLRGGLGSALKTGDILHSGKPANELIKLAARDFPVEKFIPYSQTPVIDVIPAPQADWFTAEGIRAFYESEYSLSPSFDRMGYRLHMLPSRLPKSQRLRKSIELISEGMTMGSIQIPADGQPIVMMADAPTTGGYPKIANVTRASLPLLAQCEAGVSKIRFREVTVDDARKMKIDLNCDLGEGMGDDEAIMPYITSANIACGFHAGDEHTMRETIRLAKRFGVNAGAHPSWKDKENFGRREMDVPLNEAEQIVLEQIQILAAIAKEEGVTLTHVKPHGALYNQAAKNIELARAIARAVKNFGGGLILVGLAGSRSVEAGREAGITVAAEGFPDRGYNSDGTLMPRGLPGALIESPEEVARHAVILIETMKLDTLCLHGDHPNAAANVMLLRKMLEGNGIAVAGLK